MRRHAQNKSHSSTPGQSRIPYSLTTLDLCKKFIQISTQSLYGKVEKEVNDYSNKMTKNQLLKFLQTIKIKYPKHVLGCTCLYHPMAGISCYVLRLVYTFGTGVYQMTTGTDRNTLARVQVVYIWYQHVLGGECYRLVPGRPVARIFSKERLFENSLQESPNYFLIIHAFKIALFSTENSF